MNAAINLAYTTEILIRESKRYSFILQWNVSGCQARVRGGMMMIVTFITFILKCEWISLIGTRMFEWKTEILALIH